jgi:hypothetical protein
MLIIFGQEFHKETSLCLFFRKGRKAAQKTALIVVEACRWVPVATHGIVDLSNVVSMLQGHTKSYSV